MKKARKDSFEKIGDNRPKHWNKLLKKFVRSEIWTHALYWRPEFSITTTEEDFPWVWLLRPLGHPDLLTCLHIYSYLKMVMSGKTEPKTTNYLLRANESCFLEIKHFLAGNCWMALLFNQSFSVEDIVGK